MAVLALLLAVAMTASIGLYGVYRLNHIKIGDQVFDIHLETLDLRDQNLPVEDYQMYRDALPHTQVIWDAPFQGKWYPLDTEELTISQITDEDMQSLQYFTKLKTLNATECRDYDQIQKLQTMLPDCYVNYAIHLGDQKLSPTTESLEFKSGETNAEELKTAIPHLVKLKSVNFENPEIPGQDLQELQKEFPDVTFTWNKKILGKKYEMDLKELDFSKQKVTAKEAEAYAAYFPELEKLTMLECKVDNKEMAQLRDRVRDQYKVIWGVQVGDAYLRSDVTGFIPSNSGYKVSDEDLDNLQYCEDLIAVDLGHTGKGNLAWVKGTPHLKYLIMGDGNVYNEDVAHLSCLKELEYLELFHCPVSDISPLTECTALRDLLLSETGVVNVEPLTKMPSLEHLWILNNGLGYNTKVYLEEYLPNAVVMVGGGSNHGRGWRDIDNYFKMRDALGMWYMKG